MRLYNRTKALPTGYTRVAVVLLTTKEIHMAKFLLGVLTGIAICDVVVRPLVMAAIYMH